METNDFIVKRIPIRIRPAVVIAACCILQFTYGVVYTFGNILPYLVSYLRWKVDPHQTNGSMIWLQSLMSGIPGSMLIGGYLEKKVGARAGALIGSFIYTGSMFLSYYSIQSSYKLLLLTFGAISAFGQGIAYNCVLIQAQKWLPNKVATASGFVAAGFGCGAFLMSPIQTKYINPDNYHVDSDGFFTQTDLLERVPYMFVLLASMFTLLQLLGLLFIADPIPATEESPDDDVSLIDTPESSPDIEVLSMRQVMSSSTFKVLFVTLYLNAAWGQVGSGLFKAYGMKFISDDFFLATVSSFAAATNCVSRIIWGAAMDKTSYQASMVTACTIGAFLMWTLGLVREYNNANVFFFWICGMFSVIGATYTLVPSAVHKCFGPANFGFAYGVIQLSLTLSGLTTALCSQFLLPRLGYEVMFLIFGFALAVSMAVTCCIQKTKFGRPMTSRTSTASIETVENPNFQ